MLAIFLIVIGILSRFMFHLPNFTPIIAIAMFAGALLPRKQAVIVPLALYVISDFMLGLHGLVLFTWGSMGVIGLISLYNRKHKTVKSVVAVSFISALFFYIITNFGVWYAYPTYSKTMAGLVECYVAAIPYFRNTLISTFLYLGAFFGLYEVIAARVKGTRLAPVLLSK